MTAKQKTGWMSAGVLGGLGIGALAWPTIRNIICQLFCS